MSSNMEVSIALVGCNVMVARALDSEMDIKKEDEKDNTPLMAMSLGATAQIHT